MAYIRPSVTLVFDLDERVATRTTISEIKRCYAHITTPVIRTHSEEDPEAPIVNTARVITGLGTRKYLHSSDEGADELWDKTVEPWIGNMLWKIGNNMRQYNQLEFKLGHDELHIDHFNLELQGGELIISLHTDPVSFISEDLKAMCGLARAWYNDGTFGEGVTQITIPIDEAYVAQAKNAYVKWQAEHPEPEPEPEPEEPQEDDGMAPEPDKEADYEAWLAWDIERKSYENTAVPPTDSDILPNAKVHHEDPEQPDRFDFDVDYNIWGIVYATGETRIFDSVSAEFIEAIPDYDEPEAEPEADEAEAPAAEEA